MTANQIAYQRMREENRANLAREAETNRANLAGERLRSAELAENSRHNLVSESETQRGNIARETETNRSNLAKELEAARHNYASEQINAAQVGVASQQVAANYAVGLGNLAEAQRHNVQLENIQFAGQQTQRDIADSKNATELKVADKNAANQFRQIIYKEGQANKRAKAEMETRMSTATMQGASGVINSLIRLIPWVNK